MIPHEFITVGYWAIGPCAGRESGMTYYVAKIGECWVLRYIDPKGKETSVYCKDHIDVIDHLKEIEG